MDLSIHSSSDLRNEEFDDNLCDLNLLLRLELSEFELIQNIINLDYNNTLLTLKNEMEEML